MKKGIKIAIIGFVISMLMLSVGLVCNSSEGIGRFMKECPEGIALGIAILMLIFIVVGGIGMIVFPLVLCFQYDNKKADQYNEEKLMKKFVYFVSYSHQNGFGNCWVKTNNPITTFEDIRDIENMIKGRNIKEVIILNFQLLSEIEEETD